MHSSSSGQPIVGKAAVFANAECPACPFTAAKQQGQANRSEGKNDLATMNKQGADLVNCLLSAFHGQPIQPNLAPPIYKGQKCTLEFFGLSAPWFGLSKRSNLDKTS